MNADTNSLIAKESTHWYLGADCEKGKLGDPCYTLIGKNGKERNVTLADLRKNPSWKLCPSVSGIIAMAAKPALETWKVTQSMLSALTLPRNAGEGDEAFCARIISDSKEQARVARERGTELHGAIEQAIQAKAIVPGKWQEHIHQIRIQLAQHSIDLFWGESERSFASPEGYGGRIDYSKDGVAVLDFKSKNIIEEGKEYGYEENCMQLAAYRAGLGYSDSTRLLNVFVGCEDAKVQVVEWDNEEAARGIGMFRALLNFWKCKNKIK